MKSDKEIMEDYKKLRYLEDVDDDTVSDMIGFQHYLIAVKVDECRKEIMASIKPPVKYVFKFVMVARSSGFNTLMALIATIVFIVVISIQVLYPLFMGLL